MEQKYDGYFITSCGRVWSYHRNRFLKLYKDKDGYNRIHLGKHGMKRICRLVAETYIPNPNNYDTVDHINGDKSNDCVNNLQWMSREENTRKGVADRIKRSNRVVLCVETGEIFESGAAAARAVGVDRSNIIRACNGQKKKIGGYHWEWIENENNRTF